MPSIRIRAWLELPPRRNSALPPPGPPVRAMSTPTWRPSRSIRSGAWLASMSLRSSTVIEARASSSGRSMRVAVTWTASRVVVSSACTAGTRENEIAAASAVLRKTGVMDLSPGTLTRGSMERAAGSAGETEWPNAERRPERRPVALRNVPWWPHGSPCSQSARPVSGLASGAGSAPVFRLPMPGGTVACWKGLLAYRCGGSAGFGPASRAPGAREF